jgi:hypothetical protein
MTNHNLFQYIVIDHELNPPSFGGNHEVGTYTRSCISKSPKRSLAMEEGTYSRRHEGVEGCPVLQTRQFWKGSKLLWEQVD